MEQPLSQDAVDGQEALEALAAKSSNIWTNLVHFSITVISL